MTGLRIVALDLALTDTGVAVADGTGSVDVHTVKTGNARGHQRRQTILNAVADLLTTTGPHVVVAEALFAGKYPQTVIELAKLHGIVEFYLTPRVPLAYPVETQHLKTYAVGKGAGPGTDKDAVLLAVDRRYGHLVQVRNNNESDALVLLAMALHHYGTPLVDVPKTHAVALGRVDWPQLDGHRPLLETPPPSAAPRTGRRRDGAVAVHIPLPAQGSFS